MDKLLNSKSSNQGQRSSLSKAQALTGLTGGEKGTGVNNSRIEGSQISSQHNLDQNNLISENTNQKKRKRIKLEDQKEQRIQEFLAAKRKEYEKYISLDFDYKIVEEELKKLKIIDYSKIDHDEHRKRIRDNKIQLINDRLKIRQQDDGGSQMDINDNMDGDGGVGINRIIEQMRVHITPLQDNFNQSDENFKNIPARNMDHYLLGPPKFCGSVYRKMNDKCVNEEVWVVVRGFYVFLYINQESMRPICMLRVPLNKICLEVTKGIDTKERGQKVPVEFQYFSLIERAAQSIHFFIGKKSEDFKNIKNNFYDFLKKQVAIKAYLFLCGYLNTAPDQNLIKFYENDDSTILKINLQTDELHAQGEKNTVLKPISEAFFYYTFIVAASSKNLMVVDFSDLCLWSSFLIFFFSVMKEDNVNCLLRELILDNNDITDEVLLAMLDYFKRPQSFFITSLSMNKLTDIQPTGFILIGRIISERHYQIRDSVQSSDNYQLPFQYLSLNDVKMNDTGLSNLVINLEKVQKDNFKRRGSADYDVFLELHLARNHLTESSLRSLGNLLESFQGISVLNISESQQIKSIQKEYFFNCLKNNYSLTLLNISRIEMNLDSFRSLIQLLEENYTIQTVQITLTEFMVAEISRTKNMNLLKYFMISYNPSLVFENS